MPWLADKSEEQRIGSYCGRSVAWPMWTLRHGPAPRSGASQPDRWSMWRSCQFLTQLLMVGRSLGWAESWPDLYQFVQAVLQINVWIVSFQYPADLSSRWRPDPSLPALVCAGACSQPDGGRNHRLDRRRRFHRSSRVEARCLVGRDRSVHADELLGRSEAGASSITVCKTSAPRWLCLPGL